MKRSAVIPAQRCKRSRRMHWRPAMLAVFVLWFQFAALAHAATHWAGAGEHDEGSPPPHGVCIACVAYAAAGSAPPPAAIALPIFRAAVSSFPAIEYHRECRQAFPAYRSRAPPVPPGSSF
ncbi:MAG: hypothetical protein IOMNBAOH_00086 [Rhodocyclaceae bacterium]|jgi:hypothetical protein|nr:hypothetical protein [Rhodocyclaceae bacterium]